MDSSNTLLPCPFCGADEAKVRANGIGDYFVICDADELEDESCGASTSDVRCESESAAVRRWNTRAALPEPVDTESLRSRLSYICNAYDLGDDTYLFETALQQIKELGHIPEPATRDVEREEIARVIDPEAWEEYLLEDGRVDQEVASIFRDAFEDSLAKADQIKALFASKGGEAA